MAALARHQDHCSINGNRLPLLCSTYLRTHTVISFIHLPTPTGRFPSLSFIVSAASAVMMKNFPTKYLEMKNFFVQRGYPT